jgi:hypothetical protein
MLHSPPVPTGGFLMREREAMTRDELLDRYPRETLR